MGIAYCNQITFEEHITFADWMVVIFYQCIGEELRKASNVKLVDVEKI